MISERSRQKEKHSVGSKQAALIMKQFKDTRKKNTFLYVSTMEGYSEIVQFNKEQITIYSSFRTKYPISQMFYDNETTLMYLGDITGGLSIYKFKDKDLYEGYFPNDEYSVDLKEKQPIIMIYVYGDKLYIQNLLDELKVFILPELTMKFKYTFSEAVVASIILNRRQNKSLCYGFFNNRPPFIFTSFATQNQLKIQKTIIEKYYYEEESTEDQIIQICYDQQKIITANIKNMISIYNTIQVSLNSNIVEVCELSMKIDMEASIMFIHLSLTYLSCIHQEKLQLINMKEKRCLTHTKEKSDKFNKMKWVFFIGLQSRNAYFLVSRGFNPFNEEQSKEGKPTLHIFKTGIVK